MTGIERLKDICEERMARDLVRSCKALAERGA